MKIVSLFLLVIVLEFVIVTLVHRPELLTRAVDKFKRWRFKTSDKPKDDEQSRADYLTQAKESNISSLLSINAWIEINYFKVIGMARTQINDHQILKYTAELKKHRSRKIPDTYLFLIKRSTKEIDIFIVNDLSRLNKFITTLKY